MKAKIRITKIRCFKRAAFSITLPIILLITMVNALAETVTLNPSGDTFINSTWPSDNHGSNTGLMAGMLSTGGILHSRIRFSGIPSGADIENAELRLYLTTGSGSHTLSVQSASHSWSENSLTWNSYGSTNRYTTPNSTYLISNSTGYVYIDVTSHVTEWADGTRTNYGFHLSTDGTIGENHTFASRESGTSSYRPRLVVTYSPRPPDPDLVSIAIPSSATVGEAFTVSVSAENDGGESPEGAINASVLYSDETDNIVLNGPNAPWADGTYNRAPGYYPIYSNKCGTMTAQDHMLEVVDSNWQNGESHSMSFTVTPQKEGTLYVRVRTTMRYGPVENCDYRNDFSSTGGSTGTDQQGWDCRVYTVTVNSPDPPPEPPTVTAVYPASDERSEVMMGGMMYRYYHLTDADSQPISGGAINVICNGKTYTFTADNNGKVTVSFAAYVLGQPDESCKCSITDVHNPMNFYVDIKRRESTSSYKFGSGVNVAAAAGLGLKSGKKNGMAYNIINTDLATDSDDLIELCRYQEVVAGVTKGVGIGVDIEDSGEAKAEVEAGLLAVLSQYNQYNFPMPYDESQQAIRAGLILASIFENAGPLADSLINYVLINHNPEVIQYKTKEAVSLGAKFEADAGAGIGLGQEDEDMLGMQIGAKFSGSMQFLLKMLQAYKYSAGVLYPSESANGASLSSEIDLFAGLQETIPVSNSVWAKVKTGIGGGMAGTYDMLLYTDTDGAVDRLELVFYGEKSWGITLKGFTSGTGSTQKMTLVLTPEQLDTLVSRIESLSVLSAFTLADTDGSMIFGPTKLKGEFVAMFEDLAAMNIDYKIEEERGDGISFNPSVYLGLGGKIEAGFNIDLQKSVVIEKEHGLLLNAGGGYKEVYYEFDDYIPTVESLDFGLVVDDCVEGLFTSARNAGHIVLEAANTVGQTAVNAWSWMAGQTSLQTARYLQSYSYISSNTSSSALELAFYSFTPQDTRIGSLTSKISSTTTIGGSDAYITLQPFTGTAQLAMRYKDVDITGLSEIDLILYQWDHKNKRWIPIADSVVNQTNNTVTGTINSLGTFIIGIPLPDGEIQMRLKTQDVEAGSNTAISVTTEPIKLSTGNIVPDGTKVTIQALERYNSQVVSFGQINATDADPDTTGIQVQTANGVCSFEIVPPDNEGVGVVVINTVNGTAHGKAYFNIVSDLDEDGNGLPDYWEKMYFGSTAHDPSADPDGEGLDNLEEYQWNTNPVDADTDADNLPDKWEVDNGLNPLLDDSGFDSDSDGCTNLEEFDTNRDPQVVDSIIYYQDADGDGYGNPDSSIRACAKPAGYVLDNTDTDDSDGSINPANPGDSSGGGGRGGGCFIALVL